MGHLGEGEGEAGCMWRRSSGLGEIRGGGTFTERGAVQFDPGKRGARKGHVLHGPREGKLLRA